MELRQLMYFAKVAETLNFSEAARRAYVTQSTLSQQIKQLEDELGAPLFIRNSHSVSLTENGEKLYPLAKKTLSAASDCRNQIRDLQELLTGELVIGVTYSFCPIVTETLHKFLRTYPGVKVVVCSKSMGELMDLLRRHEVDFVLAFKATEEYEDIESHVLFDDKLSVILRKDHPLAEKQQLCLKELEGFPLAIPSKGLQARNTLDKNLDILNAQLNIGMEINEVNILLDLVQTGPMVTFLSETTIHNRNQLKAVPLDLPFNRMDGCFHVLKRSYRKRSTEAFIAMLRDSHEVYVRVNKW